MHLFLKKSNAKKKSSRVKMNHKKKAQSKEDSIVFFYHYGKDTTAYCLIELNQDEMYIANKRSKSLLWVTCHMQSV